VNQVKQDKRIRTSHRGFTLVEMMVVILIIGLLAGIATQQVISRIKTARITAAKAQIAVFKGAITQYYIDTTQYPDEAVGLDALVAPPPGVDNWDPEGYLDAPQVPTDPWGYDYIYNCPGEFSAFEIISYGADGKEGGEGEDADIYSYEITESGQDEPVM